jgi:hypothetical protein
MPPPSLGGALRIQRSCSGSFTPHSARPWRSTHQASSTIREEVATLVARESNAADVAFQPMVVDREAATERLDLRRVGKRLVPRNPTNSTIARRIRLLI